jgi:hypothetical protein
VPVYQEAGGRQIPLAACHASGAAHRAGEIDGIEALDQLLVEERTMRDNRRVRRR